MSDLIGQSLGRYHILEQIGEGGMATVYKAFDTRLERDVAVKIIRTELFGKAIIERILKRFEREAKALARMSHINIVKVHDFGEHEGSPYLVLEYLPGGTLKDRLGKPMSWQQALRLLLPIADALGYAHKRKIIHRDLKPSNVLLTESDQPLLTDFGIAKILELEDAQTLTGTSVGVGTPEYMAPEQGQGVDVDARADIYALGIVLYEMVTGHKPYTANTPMAVIVKHIHDPLPRPGSFIAGLPDAIEKLLLKVLAKKPGDRYQTMEELGAAMQNLMGTHAPPERAAAPPMSKTAPSVDSMETRLQAPEEALTTDTFEQPKPAPPKNQAPTIKPAKKPPNWLPWATGGVFLLVALFGWQTGSGPSQTFPNKTPTPTNTLKPTTTEELSIDSSITREKDGMKMLYIPAGEFQMGSKDGESDEQPIHSVYLDAYWIDETEVTKAMYTKCVAISVCSTPYDSDFGDSSYSNHPVKFVSWFDAETYCEWAGARLPSEAEWEKAARGDLESKKYPWGDKSPSCQAGAKNGAQYTSCNNYTINQTVSVGSFSPNSFGIYDMAGNVWEWVADWHDSEYYANSPSNNPSGPSSGELRVLRGGSWGGGEFYLRSAYRFRYDPAKSYAGIGFRCLHSAP